MKRLDIKTMTRIIKELRKQIRELKKEVMNRPKFEYAFIIIIPLAILAPIVAFGKLVFDLWMLS